MGFTSAPGGFLGVYQIDRNQQNWPLAEMERQISWCRQHGLGGQVFFRSRFVTDNTKGIYDLLQRNLYRTPALPPQISCSLEEGEQNTGGASISYYVLYRSSTYPVDIEDSNNIYKVIGVQEFKSSRVQEFNGFRYRHCYYAVTAVNRYGIESAPLELNTPFEPRQFNYLQK